MTGPARVLAALACVVVIVLALLAVAAPWLCAWLILLATAMLSWRVSWRTSRDPFAPLLPITAYLFLGIGVRGLALREHWVSNSYNIPVSNEWLTVSVWLLGALAMLSCTVGYSSVTARRLGRKWAKWQWTGRQWRNETVTGFAVVTAAVGVVSIALLHHRFANAIGFGHTPAAVASQTADGGLFGMDSLVYFPLTGLLFSWGRRGLGLLGQCAKVVNSAAIVTWFLLTGSKSLIFEVAVGILILHHYLHRRISGRLLILCGIPALIVVSLAFYFKAYGFQLNDIKSQYSDQPAWEAVVDPLLDRSYQFDAASMILAKTKSVNDYRLGGTFEELLWFYVPRQWWPTKPVSFSYTFPGEFFPGVTEVASYTPSAVGELYLDFGVPGVLVGFYFLGVLLRASYEGLARNRSQLSIAVYAMVLFRLTNMVEGPIATHVEFLMANLLPTGVLIVATRILPPGPMRRVVPGVRNRALVRSLTPLGGSSLFEEEH
jgi:oligosaccharide repeat unit polymerase